MKSCLLFLQKHKDAFAPGSCTPSGRQNIGGVTNVHTFNTTFHSIKNEHSKETKSGQRSIYTLQSQHNGLQHKIIKLVKILCGSLFKNKQLNEPLNLIFIGRHKNIFSSFRSTNQKNNFCISRIRTHIVVVEGAYADHLTTTTTAQTDWM